jgi:hypothetical protein
MKAKETFSLVENNECGKTNNFGSQLSKSETVVNFLQ